MINPTHTNRTFSAKLRRPIGNINQTNTPPSGATPNPFGNSVQFTEVGYSDQLTHLSPPTVMVPNRFPAPAEVAGNGITIELWFKAVSSGSLVNLPMSPASSTVTAIAPVIYIDSNGFLRAGLFDSTQITLLSPQQNLIASQDANGVVTVGALNALRSPLSVVDNQWHHAAFVVQPGANGVQSLYLDGRLAATGTGNGSFGLSFVASDGTTWTAVQNSTPASTAPLGGPITPQPAFPSSPNYLPYAQGFCGCLNEVRIWNGPRIITSIQSLLDQSLGSNLGPYEQQGLVGYVGSSQLATAVQPSAYLSLVADAPPFDPFTGVTRVPGYQNYGIGTAIPFTTVAPQVTFQPSQTYSTKISLYQLDQLQVSFPATDAHGDNLTGTFSMTLTGAAGGQIQTNSQIPRNTDFTITAPATDCYRFDFTYSATTPCTIDNLQFMVIPSPHNSLMQLILDVVPGQAAYTDPNYPISSTTLPDPRNPGQTVTLPAYWPLFTNQTVFPIDPTKFSANDLLTAYLNLDDAARTLSLQSGATFSDFFNLSANKATIYEVADISTLLAGAYQKVTGNRPPAAVPTAPFDNAVDQVYAFIYNVNAMRNTLSEFLTAYKGWAQIAINELALASIPSKVANQIYDGQEQINVDLQGSSTGFFILNLIIGSAIVGLGAVLPMLPAAFAGAAAVAEGAAAAASETVTAGAVAGEFAANAGANALTDLLGAFLGSSSAQPSLSHVSYTTLEDVVNHVANDTSSVYNTLLANLLNPAYVQTLYSNYGLLQALSFVNAQPLYTANKVALQPGSNNSLIIGTTYASWKALIPSVFTWTPQLLTGQELDSNNVVFQVTNGKALSLPYQEVPSELGVFTVLQNDPWQAFYWMLHQIQQWQTGAESLAGQFYSICPIFYYNEPGSSYTFETTADWVVAWSLTDANKNTIADDVAASLFGTGNSNTPLTLADQNNPLVAAGYGWYCATANGAVTTPFDAFMNWGAGVPSYSPQVLAAQLPENGNLYSAREGSFGELVTFASAAAADTPPAALVTLVPSSLNFGAVPVGTQAKLTAVMTNNQQNALPLINAALSDGFTFVTLSISELQPGQSTTITVDFLPRTAGPQSGTITFTTQGQYGPITLTLQCSGTGV